MTAGFHRATSDDDLDTLRQFFTFGGSLRMLAEIDPKHMGTLFEYAQQLFEAGDLSTARSVFLILVRIDQWNSDYWFSLGQCFQRLGLYNESIGCFARSGLIKVDDPRSAYFAGISYRLTGNNEYAIRAFRAALGWCGNRESFRGMKEDAMRQLADCERGELR
jgi:secretion system chaperone SscA